MALDTQSGRTYRALVTGAVFGVVVAAGSSVAAAGPPDPEHRQSPVVATVTGVTGTVAKRIVINQVITPGTLLLKLPGLGVLKAACPPGGSDASVRWTNTSGAPVDVWTDYNADGHTRPFIAPASASNVFVAYWHPGNEFQIGTHLDLGQGNSPGPRKTASIEIHAYRSGQDAPCGFQATATTWHTP
jgi:hypothetical protein